MRRLYMFSLSVGPETLVRFVEAERLLEFLENLAKACVARDQSGRPSIYIKEARNLEDVEVSSTCRDLFNTFYKREPRRSESNAQLLMRFGL